MRGREALQQRPGVVRSLFRRAGRGREDILEGWYGREGQERLEPLPEGWEGSGSTPERPGGIGRPSWRSFMGQESLIGRP